MESSGGHIWTGQPILMFHKFDHLEQYPVECDTLYSGIQAAKFRRKFVSIFGVVRNVGNDLTENTTSHAIFTTVRTQD